MERYFKRAYLVTTGMFMSAHLFFLVDVFGQTYQKGDKVPADSQAVNNSRLTPLNLPANTWVTRSVPSFAGSPGPGDSKHIRLAYDSDRHLIYMWGGDYCVGNSLDGSRCASHEEFWSYDVARDKWELLLDQKAAVAPEYPTGRCVPAFTYDPKRKIVWMTSGQERYQNYHPNLQSGGIWAFDPAIRKWTRQGDGPDQAGVVAYADEALFMAYDPVNDAIIVPDGRNGQMGLFKSATWTIQPNVSAVNDPYVQQNNVHAVDTRRNRIIFYSAGRGETWAYDFASRQSRLLSKQQLPMYANFSMVYDSANDAVALWGGGTVFDPDLNDLWVYSLTTRQWSKKVLSGTPPARGIHSQMTYDSHNNAIVLYGEQIFLVRLDLRKAK